MLAKPNPFSTKFTRPGAIPFQFPADVNSRCLVDRFCLHGQRGAIVGPHGSGKSTLLEALQFEFVCRCWTVMKFTLREGESALREDWAVSIEQRSHDSDPLVVVIDGYEQLHWYARWRLHFVCRRVGLLVTAHADVGYPTIFNTSPDEQLLHSIVARLLGEIEGVGISKQAITEAWQEHSGNIREALFALYDVYERQRRC